MAHLLIAVIYLAFISLGLPDAMLGAAWPVIYTQFSVPVWGAGVISVIICCGTITSSLMGSRLVHRLGTGMVTAASVALTAAALFGFSLSSSYLMLCLWAVPYGLGAGSVDAALNNYVAVNYKSHHMSWLHCMWGLGASTGPYIMGRVLTAGKSWQAGYRYTGVFQLVLSLCIIFTLFLWKNGESGEQEEKSKALSLKEVVKIKGAKEIMLAFFCYCAAEQTAMLWCGSYLVLHCSLPEETAASFASLFLIGLTAGRFLNGFVTFKFNDKQMIYTGQLIMLAGGITMLLPFGVAVKMAGIALVGLGCAPIYPCIIHSTPSIFGRENSSAVIGVQMASAYVGAMVAPAVFGFMAQYISIGTMPLYLLAITVVMVISYTRAIKS